MPTNGRIPNKRSAAGANRDVRSGRLKTSRRAPHVPAMLSELVANAARYNPKALDRVNDDPLAASGFDSGRYSDVTVNCLLPHPSNLEHLHFPGLNIGLLN